MKQLKKGSMPRDYKLHNRLGFQLSRLSRMMQGQLEERLEEHGLTRMKWCVLSGVAVEGKHAPSELADHIGITRPAVSKLIKVMISEGLIERSLVEEDGRSRQISVTPSGRNKLDLCWSVIDETQHYYMDKLPPDQHDSLFEMLRTMLQGEEDMFDEF